MEGKCRPDAVLLNAGEQTPSKVNLKVMTRWRADDVCRNAYFNFGACCARCAGLCFLLLTIVSFHSRHGQASALHQT
jgi:hypothetical protein